MDQTLQGFAPYLRALPAPELRKDPITNRWVIVATERAQRPVAARNDLGPEEALCPFCPGQEGQTPPEVFAFRAEGTRPNEPGWRVRVVPNRYPAVRPLDDARRSEAGLFTTRTGFGVHEVIVECPEHALAPGQLSAEAYREILLAYRDRLTHHGRDPQLAYAQVFRNVGTLAGASLSHPHSQLIGMPVVPCPARGLTTARTADASSATC
jgi:UDPglucose--hexose-1-phosphate uridylyltransferase